jgi:hypothetical protein
MSEHLIDADTVERIFMAWLLDLVTQHGLQRVSDVLSSPAIQAAFTGEVGQSVIAYPQCSLCNIPLATGTCTHVLITGKGQVTMTEAAWERLVAAGTDATLREEPEPSAIEVGGVRMEYDKQADAILHLAAAVRFHGVMMGGSKMSMADIQTVRDITQ